MAQNREKLIPSDNVRTGSHLSSVRTHSKFQKNRCLLHQNVRTSFMDSP